MAKINKENSIFILYLIEAFFCIFIHILLYENSISNYNTLVTTLGDTNIIWKLQMDQIPNMNSTILIPNNSTYSLQLLATNFYVWFGISINQKDQF